MPNLESFLGKDPEKKVDTSRWDVLYGLYGCQHCSGDVDVAYFNEETMTMIWTCSEKHESKLEIV